ncbi:MAG: efflux RND transporter periplasmic adaptor subunit [Acidobacteria bacterium]|nr:efflux RND transporter periplasmic adaptor subunit [Acidobacteriota bacterium]
MTRIVKLSSLFLLLIALASAGCSRKNTNAEAAPGNNGAPATPAGPVEIRTATAIERLIERNIETVGQLVADDEVTVSSQVRGEVSEMNIDLGSFVKAGQVIARISPQEYELKLKQAEAALQQACAKIGLTAPNPNFDIEQAPEVKQAKASLDETKLKMERTRKLIESGDVSQDRWDTVEINHRTALARYDAARDNIRNQLATIDQRSAEVQLARKNLNDSTITSPISGTVSQKLTSRGEYISEMGGNRSIATIVRSNPLRLQAGIPEVGVSFVKPGVGVDFTVDTYPGRTFKAQVSRISPDLNAQSRLLMVEATAENNEDMLKPGMFAKVFVKTTNKIPVVLVPVASVTSIAGLNKVFVVQQDKVVERQVKLGLRDGDMIEITEGVKKDEPVAVSNLSQLSNGVAVATK